MKLVGLMPVRNESWCLGLTARVALQWCNDLVIFDHASTDASIDIELDIAHEYAGRVTIICETNPLWDEMRHRQTMLETARARGATHIAIIDADELLTGNLLGQIRNYMELLPRMSILQLPGYNLRNSMMAYHSNGIWGDRWFSCGFVDDPALHWAGDRFHSREPHGFQLRGINPVDQGYGGIMHLWGVSERRLKAKHALYKITERLRWPQKPVEEIDREYSWAIHGDSRNRAYGTPASWGYAKVPDSWWQPYEGLLKHLDINSAPWQQGECRRLIDEYGPEPFSRLDLFGVV